MGQEFFTDCIGIVRVLRRIAYMSQAAHGLSWWAAGLSSGAGSLLGEFFDEMTEFWQDEFFHGQAHGIF